MVKLKATRSLMKEIKKFSSFPFALRYISDQKTARFAINEMLKHELVEPFPVVFEKNDTLVAQIKFTVLLLDESQERLNNFSPAFVSSELSIDNNTEIQNILMMNTSNKME